MRRIAGHPGTRARESFRGWRVPCVARKKPEDGSGGAALSQVAYGTAGSLAAVTRNDQCLPLTAKPAPSTLPGQKANDTGLNEPTSEWGKQRLREGKSTREQ